MNLLVCECLCFCVFREKRKGKNGAFSLIVNEKKKKIFSKQDISVVCVGVKE